MGLHVGDCTCQHMPIIAHHQLLQLSHFIHPPCPSCDVHLLHPPFRAAHTRQECSARSTSSRVTRSLTALDHRSPSQSATPAAVAPHVSQCTAAFTSGVSGRNPAVWDFVRGRGRWQWKWEPGECMLAFSCCCCCWKLAHVWVHPQCGG